MSNRTSSDWDPRDTSVLGDQRGAYDDMRERCPVAHSDYLGWSIFRHKDVMDILADPETYSNQTRRRHIPNGMDPPEHTAYRNAIAPYFGAEWMARFEPHGRKIANRVARSLPESGDVDLISSFAEPFVSEALCAYLGWPADRADQLLFWIKRNQEATLSRDGEAGKALALELIGVVNDALNARREGREGSPDDLTSSLMAVEVDGEPLSDDDIASILRNWIAGHGTVIASVGLLMLHLAQHPDTQQKLRDDPSLLPTAIDEILRTDGPLVNNTRTTTREVTIGGRKIDAGEQLALMWISLNRDGEAFDNPDEVRLDREDGPNLLFGWGIHDCVGAPLARLELQLAMEALLARTGGFGLAGDEPPTRSVYPSNGVRKLPARITS